MRCAFWRTQLESDVLGAVNLGSKILTTSPDGKWLLTENGSGVALHPADVTKLIRAARLLAGRDLTPDEQEQFMIRSATRKR
jgi:hypothetical protein